MQILSKILIFIIFITILSCEKEPITYNNSNVSLPNSDGQKSIPLEGKWLLISGRMYFKTADGINDPFKLDHFSSTKLHSSMNYGGANYRIEELYKDSTTWEFKFNSNGYGKFILDNDTNDFYHLQSGGDMIRIIENQSLAVPTKMNGSAKPFLAFVNNFDEEIIDIIVNWSDKNDDGYNYSYYNVLQFKKQ